MTRTPGEMGEKGAQHEACTEGSCDCDAAQHQGSTAPGPARLGLPVGPDPVMGGLEHETGFDHPPHTPGGTTNAPGPGELMPFEEWAAKVAEELRKLGLVVLTVGPVPEWKAAGLRELHEELAAALHRQEAGMASFGPPSEETLRVWGVTPAARARMKEIVREWQKQKAAAGRLQAGAGWWRRALAWRRGGR